MTCSCSSKGIDILVGMVGKVDKNRRLQAPVSDGDAYLGNTRGPATCADHMGADLVLVYSLLLL